MLVTCSFEYCRTRFQTLITSPQVVSTSTQPLASSFLRVLTSVPKAGMMTASPDCRLVQFLLGRLGGDDLDAHVADLVVHLGVVDDFAEQINRRVRRVVGKIFPRGVGEVNRALDAVAEAEFLGELHGEFAGGKHATAGADALDDFAAVMRQHLGLHRLHDVGAAEVDFFLRCGRSC